MELNNIHISVRWRYIWTRQRHWPESSLWGLLLVLFGSKRAFPHADSLILSQYCYYYLCFGRMCLPHVVQSILCIGQCSFWQSLLQYLMMSQPEHNNIVSFGNMPEQPKQNVTLSINLTSFFLTTIQLQGILCAKQLIWPRSVMISQTYFEYFS